MKSLLFFAFLFISLSVFSQKARMEKDTIYYGSNKYWVGKEVQLFYGSDPKKNFVFVTIGTGMAGFDPLNSTHSKKTVKIDKIDKRQNKFYIRGNFTENPIPMNKILIDVEGAIDMKEIKEDL